MDEQVLVAYGTKYGATAGIAEKIGEVLREASLQADVLPADQVGDLAPYSAVVLGSAVYIASWRKEARAFLKANVKALAERPVWLFSAGPPKRAIRWNCWKAGVSQKVYIPSPIKSSHATSPSSTG